VNTSRQVIVNASAHSIPFPDGMIHTVACSPPYYSLRQYQGEQEFDWPAMSYSPMPGLPPIDIEPMRCALGLEPTPEAYIGHLVLCFREVWRTLRDDGTAWIVMGDSYSGGGGYSPNAPSNLMGSKQSTNKGSKEGTLTPDGLHQGDLMLIPHRLALALQGDGWIVRNDVVWAKVAPMPESVSGWHWSRHQVNQDDRRRSKATFPTTANDQVATVATSGATYRISLTPPGNPAPAATSARPPAAMSCAVAPGGTHGRMRRSCNAQSKWATTRIRRG